MPVAEPEPQTPSMQAPLASQVLAEEDVFPAEPPVSEEPEVTVDDVMNLSSLVEEPVLPSEPEYGSSDSVYPRRPNLLPPCRSLVCRMICRRKRPTSRFVMKN